MKVQIMGKPPHVETMSQKAFDGLPTYDISIPTGPRIGFKWKRKNGPCYWMAEAVDIRDVDPTGDPEKDVGIIWCKIEIREK